MAPMRCPKLTVLTAVQNGERYLGRTIESVLGQDFSDFEYIIVDDGSTDRTSEILQQWAARDPRVAVEHIADSAGVSAALNRGLKLARGRYIRKQDSDDICLDASFSVQVALLDSEPDVVLVSAGYVLVDVDGRWAGKVVVDIPSALYPYLLNFSNAVPGAGPHGMFRRDAARAIGGFREDIEASVDYEFLTRLIKCGRFVALPSVGSLKRNHPDQISVRLQGAQRSNSLATSRRMLTEFLERKLSDEEYVAVASIWRREGRVGVAAKGNAVLQEALARFESAQPDRILGQLVRKITAERWVLSAITLVRQGKPGEALRHFLHALRWHRAGSVSALTSAARRLLMRVFRTIRPAYPDRGHQAGGETSAALRIGLGSAKRRGTAEHIEHSGSSSCARNSSSSRSLQEESSGRYRR